MHKKRFSFLKSMIHYYVFILDNTDVKAYIDSFVDRLDDLCAKRSLVCTNNYACLIFFKNEISDEELTAMKELIISQDIVQEIPRRSYDTVVPIVYDGRSREYIVRIHNTKQWYKPIYRATKNFCRLILNSHCMEIS